jgi:hypothetical protein
MEFTSEDYKTYIDKLFNKIGKPYSKSKTMAFMADGETQELEEPDNTFTSMNFVWGIINEVPGKYCLLMNRQQSIRFIRVVKQRILKILNNQIDFINIHLSKVERTAFNKKVNGKFIEKLTKRLRDISEKYNISYEDLYSDTPMVVQHYIDMYEDPYRVPSSEREAVNHSEIVKTNIAEFQLDMEDIDEEDKKKYAEDDTPIILYNIVRLKKEFLDKFTHQVYLIFEEYYDKEVKELNDELIQFYTERLTSIRKSAHFKPSTTFNPYIKTRFDVRREKEESQKKLTVRVNPKPRTRRIRVVSQNNALQNNKPLVLKKKTQPKPRTRRTRVVSQNNALQNNKPLVLKKKTQPKPRTRRTRSVSQNNTRSAFTQLNTSL